jgi:hypothetical protein
VQSSPVLLGSAGPEGYPGELWDWLLAGVQHVQGPGMPVVVDPSAWLWGGYPDVVWVWFRDGGWCS